MSNLIEQLIDALCCLKGVGRKSAQRMAFALLQRDRDNGFTLAATLEQALKQVGHCRSCRTFSETEICQLCENPRRDNTTLCVIETPLDVMAIEQTGNFNGRYFVLMGHLSPIEGIGPDDIGIPQLQQLVAREPIKEIILATNPTVEGEATAHYISQVFADAPLQFSRIAHGVPVGGEIEYLDPGTLSRAFTARTKLQNSSDAL